MTRVQRETDDVGRIAGGRLKRAAAVEVCPDAEVLAAYVDGGLSDDEVTRVDAHLATCVRCRALMARLAPVEAAPSPAVSVNSGRTWRIEPRWLSLAAMFLVGAVLWMAWPRGTPPSQTVARGDVGPSTESAAPLEAPAPERAAPVGGAGAGAGSNAAGASSAPTAAAGAAAAKTSRADTEARQRTEDRRVAVGGVSKPQEPAAFAQAPPPVTQPAPPPPAPTAPLLGARRMATATAPSPAAPTPSPADAAPAEGAGGAPARSADKLAMREEVMVTAPAPTLQTSRQAVFERVSFSFAEPEERLHWRVVNERRIESSSDGGSTWNVSFEQGAVRLRAGAAPSLSSAWICGARGLVLRRVVPGGWTRVAPPTSEDLVAITATSDSAARVTTQRGQVFETTDGGATWTAR